ncbi:hypothetical protein V493_01034 [Pseudogymnoascus sp. VKM F-4281 (FW-2241)]|nr:hypothetical protein V493_01034 [Pseudogymnoascus sp. VKM F-4281 (FW-2241)]
MNHQRDRHAPRGLPCKEQDEFDRSPEVQELNKSIAEATAKMGDKPEAGSLLLAIQVSVASKDKAANFAGREPF